MTQKEISQVFTDKPAQLGVIQIPRFGWIGRKLNWYRSIPITVGIIPSGKVQIIGSYLKDMTDYDDIKNLSQPDQINTLLSENIHPIIDIIGIAVSGNREQSPKHIINAIAMQWGSQQLREAFYEVYRRLDLQPFFDILSLAKNLNLNLFPDQEAPGQQP